MRDSSSNSFSLVTTKRGEREQGSQPGAGLGNGGKRKVVFSSVETENRAVICGIISGDGAEISGHAARAGEERVGVGVVKPGTEIKLERACAEVDAGRGESDEVARRTEVKFHDRRGAEGQRTHARRRCEMDCCCVPRVGSRRKRAVDQNLIGARIDEAVPGKGASSSDEDSARSRCGTSRVTDKQCACICAEDRATAVGVPGGIA